MIQEKLTYSEIISELDLKSDGFEDVTYEGITTIDNLMPNYVLIIKDVDDSIVSRLESTENCLIITQKQTHNFPFRYLTVKNTRLSMAKILQLISKKRLRVEPNIHPLAFVHENAKVSKSAVIKAFAYIDDNVVIGDNSIVSQGTVILSGSVIGNNVIIRENSVIGGQGFGVEKDEEGNNFKIPHLGGVVIDDNVEIGAFNTIVAGTINPTRIMYSTKIDDHVHVGHNSSISPNCIITAGAIIGGSAKLKDNVYVGLNSIIKNQISVDQNTMIGMMTSISKNITEQGLTYAGNPGQEFKEFLLERKKLKRILSSDNEEI